MMLLGFLLFALFLNAAPCWGAVCRKWRPERMFAAGLLGNGLLFYFACAFGLPRAGFYVILGANLALYLPVVLKLRRDPGAIRRFTTPAVAAFHLLLGAGFLLAVREHPTLWDEFSHWCAAPKFLFEYGTLNCAQSGLLEHASYPPGLPVLDVLVHRCFAGVPFRDFLPRFAVRTAILSVFLIPFGDAPRRKTFAECAFGMLLLWTLALLLLDFHVWSCESDCILGAVFAAAVYVALRRSENRRDDLFLALLLAWLFLIKKAGMGFAVMVQLLYCVRRLADRRDDRKAKFPTWTSLLVLAAPSLMQLSWSLLLELRHTPIIFPVGGISPAGIWRLVRYGEPAYAGEVARMFLRQLPGCLPIPAAAAAYLALYWRTGENRPRRGGDLGWFIPLAAAAFLVTLFLTYIFIFNERQALLLVSFSRYVGGFMLMPTLTAGMLFCSEPGSKRRAAPVACGVAAALLVLPAAISRRAMLRDGAWTMVRWPRLRAEIDARYGKLLRSPGTRFVAVTGTGDGVYRYILLGEYELNFAGEILAEADRPSVPELERELRKARHVLFLHPPDDFAEKHAELWETPPARVATPSLYEVAPESGLLRPVTPEPPRH